MIADSAALGRAFRLYPLRRPTRRRAPRWVLAVLDRTGARWESRTSARRRLEQLESRQGADTAAHLPRRGGDQGP